MRLLFGCALAAACAHGGVHDAGQRAIQAELDDFHDAAAKADEARYFGHFAPDGVFLGTDAGERWDVGAFRAYAHPYFAKGKAWSFHGVRRRVAVRGDTAWFEADLETPNLGPPRDVIQRCLNTGAWTTRPSCGAGCGSNGISAIQVGAR